MNNKENELYEQFWKIMEQMDVTVGSPLYFKLIKCMHELCSVVYINGFRAGFGEGFRAGFGEANAHKEQAKNE